MPEMTYKLIEIVGVSEESIQQAVRNGLAKASETLRNLDWFEVSAIRGAVLDNCRPLFQVEMKVGFRLLEHGVLADATGMAKLARRGTAGRRAKATGAKKKHR